MTAGLDEIGRLHHEMPIRINMVKIQQRRDCRVCALPRNVVAQILRVKFPGKRSGATDPFGPER